MKLIFPSTVSRILAFLSLSLLGVVSSSAALVQNDFNVTGDSTTTAAGSLVGQAGGGGFSGNWSGNSQVLAVAGGDLTTGNSSLTQFGTGQTVQSPTSGLSPTANRTLATPLTGTVWLSFLARNDADDRAGVTLNPDGGAGGIGNLNFIFVNGNEFRVRDSAATTLYSNMTLSANTTYLTLAQLVVSGSNVTLNVYLNPNVASTLSPGTLGAPSYSTTVSGMLTANQISTLGVQSYGSGDGGQIDALRLSDGSGNNTLGFLQATRTTFFDNTNSSASYNWSTASAWQTTESSTTGRTWIANSNVVVSKTTAAITIDTNSLSASSLEVRSGSALTLNGLVGSSKQLTVTGVVKGNFTLDGSAMGSGETVSVILANTSSPLDGKATLQGSGAGRAVLQVNAGSAVSTLSRVELNGNSLLRLNPGATGQVFTLGEISGSGSSATLDDGTTTYTGITTLAINQTTDTTLAAQITKTSAGAGVFGLTKSGAGKLTLTNGTSDYNGATTISDGTLSVGILANGGAASSIGASSNSASNLVFDGGTLEYTGASVTSDRAFTINTGKTATVNVTQSGTRLEIAGATGASTNGGLTKSGAGTLALSGNNTFTGNTLVTAGTLVIDGNFASAAVTVNSGAGLGGSGTIAGATTIAGNLRPGNSPGVLNFSDDLTLTSSANSIFEIQSGTPVRGTTYDGVNVGDLLTYDGTLTLTMTSLIGDGAYNLFDFTSIGGNFDTVVFAGGIYTGTFTHNAGFWTATDTNGSGQTFSFELASGNLSVIPEPSTTLLLTGALTALVIFRRRRA